jgi:hypothetical protein
MVQTNISIVKRKMRDSEEGNLQMLDTRNEFKNYTLNIRQEKKKKNNSIYSAISEILSYRARD